MMKNDFQRLAAIYEGYQGMSIDLPRKNYRGTPARPDNRNSYMPAGVANAGGADNAYQANAISSGVENEEEPVLKDRLFDFCNNLRQRGYEQIANELALLIDQ